jgi:uncharacterized protein
VKIIRLAGAVFLAYALFAVTTCSLQRSMIFFPTRAPAAELDALAELSGFARWKTPGGTPIGWKSLDGNPSRPAIIFHGNAGHALHRAGLADRLREASPDLTVHILEYPGYGDRDGSPSEASLTAAAIEAIEAVQGRPLLVGESIGTGVACLAASAAPGKIAGLLLITPFDSLVSVAQHHYPWFPVRWLMTDRFDSSKALKDFTGPAAFVIAEYDEITPPESGQKLHDTYQGKKRLLVVKGARHNDATSRIPLPQWQDLIEFTTPPNSPLLPPKANDP